jgi:alkanesulfonate monooxygenase
MAVGEVLSVYSTCPPSNRVDGDYVSYVGRVARWSEAAGCTGTLVYTDNGLVDPWLTAQIVLQQTERLKPLVAVQPVYMHPYAVAKMVATLGHLHGRAVCLNMVAGGFRNDLLALNDPTPHDRRYDRLVEYTELLMRLLKAGEVVTWEGEFYQVRNLKLTPPLSPDLYPVVTISGSSEAGLSAARRLGAIAVQYPRPAAEYNEPDADTGGPKGIRVGIIARFDSDEAWAEAHRRFPPDRKGELTHQLAMKVSDSEWHRQLSELGTAARSGRHPYWLVPFESYKTFCPYLVGTYEQVAEEVGRYMELGYRTMILDVPSSPEELEHIRVVLDMAHAVQRP